MSHRVVGVEMRRTDDVRRSRMYVYPLRDRRVAAKPRSNARPMVRAGAAAASMTSTLSRPAPAYSGHQRRTTSDTNRARADRAATCGAAGSDVSRITMPAVRARWPFCRRGWSTPVHPRRYGRGTSCAGCLWATRPRSRGSRRAQRGLGADCLIPGQSLQRRGPGRQTPRGVAVGAVPTRFSAPGQRIRGRPTRSRPESCPPAAGCPRRELVGKDRGRWESQRPAHVCDL